MRYWWVNHKQTSAHEISGGFLWSPMFKANGARNYFYDTMRMASPGDKVISYSNSKISYVGVVKDFARPAPKPLSFGNAGENWDKHKGWLLEVGWIKLEESVRPKPFFNQLKKSLPPKYSPISLKTGNGNQGAYLAEVDKSVFEILFRGVDTFSECAAKDFTASSALLDIDNQIEREILNDQNLDVTIKKTLVLARVGQGAFKEKIYEFESGCRLTGVETPGLLIASHIKPWRLCESAFERLDGANGFLLTPSVDRLFDRGWISFGDDGAVLVSSKIDRADLDLMGLGCVEKVVGKSFHVRQKSYLAFHRDNVFIG